MRRRDPIARFSALPAACVWGSAIAAIIAGLGWGAIAQAQSEGYCFLTDDNGVTYDLGPLCNTTPRSLPSSGGNVAEVVLTWATVDDVDLAVTEPDGSVIAFYSPVAASGGNLSEDANMVCIDPVNNPVERIIWPTTIPSGTYTIEVSLAGYCRNTAESVPFTVQLTVNGEVTRYNGSVSSLASSTSFTFTVP